MNSYFSYSAFLFVNTTLTPPRYTYLYEKNRFDTFAHFCHGHALFFTFTYKTSPCRRHRKYQAGSHPLSTGPIPVCSVQNADTNPKILSGSGYKKRQNLVFRRHRLYGALAWQPTLQKKRDGLGLHPGYPALDQRPTSLVYPMGANPHGLRLCGPAKTGQTHG